jgi:hypothetical protein
MGNGGREQEEEKKDSDQVKKQRRDEAMKRLGEHPMGRRRMVRGHLKVAATHELFFGERTHEIDDVPDFIGLQPAFFAHHLALAVVNEVVNIAVV